MGEAHKLDYESRAPKAVRRFFTPAGSFLLAGFCAFIEFAGWFATNGRINGWADLSFILVVAFVGLVGLIEGFHCAWQRKNAGRPPVR